MANNRVPGQPETVNPMVDGRSEDDGEIGTMDSIGLGGKGEIEIDEVQTQIPRPRGQEAPPRFVKVRVNCDIEQMSWVAGGRREEYNFESGHMYQIPVYIAQELENQGKIWH